MGGGKSQLHHPRHKCRRARGKLNGRVALDRAECNGHARATALNHDGSTEKGLGSFANLVSSIRHHRSILHHRHFTVQQHGEHPIGHHQHDPIIIGGAPLMHNAQPLTMVLFREHKTPIGRTGLTGMRHGATLVGTFKTARGMTTVKGPVRRGGNLVHLFVQPVGQDQGVVICRRIHVPSELFQLLPHRPKRDLFQKSRRRVPRIATLGPSCHGVLGLGLGHVQVSVVVVGLFRFQQRHQLNGTIRVGARHGRADLLSSGTTTTLYQEVRFPRVAAITAGHGFPNVHAIGFHQ
mmetsp:Transcript_18633/g.50958  ORF Transcript_18633/g.50958 Transcript_18633/m.50958 type:complete len:293 (+) Transcript_18633:1003-1881(+)